MRDTIDGKRAIELRNTPKEDGSKRKWREVGVDLAKEKGRRIRYNESAVEKAVRFYKRNLAKLEAMQAAKRAVAEQEAKTQG